MRHGWRGQQWGDRELLEEPSVDTSASPLQTGQILLPEQGYSACFETELRVMPQNFSIRAIHLSVASEFHCKKHPTAAGVTHHILKQQYTLQEKPLM